LLLMKKKRIKAKFFFINRIVNLIYYINLFCINYINILIWMILIILNNTITTYTIL